MKDIIKIKGAREHNLKNISKNGTKFLIHIASRTIPYNLNFFVLQ